jgi:hypothetical protein
MDPLGRDYNDEDESTLIFRIVDISDGSLSSFGNGIQWK